MTSAPLLSWDYATSAAHNAVAFANLSPEVGVRKVRTLNRTMSGQVKGTPLPGTGISIDKPFATFEGAMQHGHYCEFLIATLAHERLQETALLRFKR